MNKRIIATVTAVALLLGICPSDEILAAFENSPAPESREWAAKVAGGAKKQKTIDISYRPVISLIQIGKDVEGAGNFFPQIINFLQRDEITG